MKVKMILALVALLSLNLSAQKLKTRAGMVRFFSETPLENIEAVNNQVSSVLVPESGQFAFLVPIKAFVFEKALMQEHFNENYMESGQYPNASFKGNIENIEKINFSKEGEYEAVFSGTMEIHGVQQEIQQPVTLFVDEDKLTAKAQFMLLASDYDVEIPAAKKDNISNDLEITVNVVYKK
jgi:hypothetical protein